MYMQSTSGTPTVPFSPMVSVTMAQPAPSHHQPSTPIEYTQPCAGGVAIISAPPPPPPPQPSAAEVSSTAMRLLQTPMSSLGKLLSGDKPAPGFPDPSSLKLLPPTPSDGGDLFCRPLAESWWTVPLETCLRGVRHHFSAALP